MHPERLLFFPVSSGGIMLILSVYLMLQSVFLLHFQPGLLPALPSSHWAIFSQSFDSLSMCCLLLRFW
jgi:hypothetical protein